MHRHVHGERGHSPSDGLAVHQLRRSNFNVVLESRKTYSVRAASLFLFLEVFSPAHGRLMHVNGEEFSKYPALTLICSLALSYHDSNASQYYVQNLRDDKGVHQVIKIMQKIVRVLCGKWQEFLKKEDRALFINSAFNVNPLHIASRRGVRIARCLSEQLRSYAANQFMLVACPVDQIDEQIRLWTSVIQSDHRDIFSRLGLNTQQACILVARYRQPVIKYDQEDSHFVVIQFATGTWAIEDHEHTRSRARELFMSDDKSRSHVLAWVVYCMSPWFETRKFNVAGGGELIYHEAYLNFGCFDKILACIDEAEGWSVPWRDNQLSLCEKRKHA
ncbi:hypothetical protein SELMODRAFT_421583 [Selaginella moellendorffii]|uniref:Uncharacterized protein n=1 Tax=Selaginella moellendorffii TaxID=88036 RepID=D8SFQ5_SELML|nr:hypothetical protein SELMODRAFT_421583 [Selaginella moellendorffii]